MHLISCSTTLFKENAFHPECRGTNPQISLILKRQCFFKVNIDSMKAHSLFDDDDPHFSPCYPLKQW